MRADGERWGRKNVLKKMGLTGRIYPRVILIGFEKGGTGKAPPTQSHS